MKGYPITRVNAFFPKTSNLISHHPKAFCIFQCDSRLGDNQKKKKLLRYHSSGKENAATHLKRTSVTETFSKGGVHGL